MSPSSAPSRLILERFEVLVVTIDFRFFADDGAFERRDLVLKLMSLGSSFSELLRGSSGFLSTALSMELSNLDFWTTVPEFVAAAGLGADRRFAAGTCTLSVPASITEYPLYLQLSLLGC